MCWWCPGHIATVLVWDVAMEDDSQRFLTVPLSVKGKAPRFKLHDSPRRVCNIGNINQVFVFYRLSLSLIMFKCVWIS